MPLYEYECDRGHRFERIVKFSDPPIDVCPECGAPVHKLMSSPAIQFKGSGFYINDYARKGSESKETKDTKETKTGETKAGDAKETKETTETKTEKPAETTSSKTTSAASSATSTKSE
jgi:putative FmdB family regulatory protein